MPLLALKPRTPERQNAERAGRRAEWLAALYLRCKFYTILTTRYKTPVGEIDLIAQRFGVTIFVEVKARRRREDEGDALLAVNQSRIVRAASFYITRNPHLANQALRFDVIFLAPATWPRHVINAFSA